MMRTNRRGFLLGTSGFAAMTLASPALVRATQNWPNRPVTIVVSFPAGGLTDAVARNFSQYISQKTGQQFIVDNKPGAGGNIGAALVAREEADGYTFLHTISGTLVQNRVLYSKLGFDPDKDFKLVAGTPSGALPLAVHKSVPVRSIKEFVAWARTNKVSFGTWAPGSTAHVVCQKLNALHGLEMVPVHYRGEAPMWQDMSAGSLQVAMGSYQALKPLLDKGMITPIAIPGPARQPLLPDVPTMKEEGYTQPAFSLHGWLALAAPANVPQPIIERLSALWIEAARSDSGRRMMATFGLTEPPLDHIQVAADYEALKAQTIPLVRELNVKLD